MTSPDLTKKSWCFFLVTKKHPPEIACFFSTPRVGELIDLKIEFVEIPYVSPQNDLLNCINEMNNQESIF